MKDSITGQEIIDYDFLGKKLYPPKKTRLTDASKAFARMWAEIDRIYSPGKKASFAEKHFFRSPRVNRQLCMVKMFYTDSKDAHRKFLREYMPQKNKSSVKDKPELFNERYSSVPDSVIDEYEKNMDGLGFKFIISPESQNVPMRSLVRQFVKDLENMTGYKFRWLAAVHTDTDHIHSHLLINGVDRNGRKIRFKSGIIKEAARNTAADICTALVGERSRELIEASRTRLPLAKRHTRLDEQISSTGGYFRFPEYKRLGDCDYEASKTTCDDVEIQRLNALAEMGLAVKYDRNRPPVFYLEKDWLEKLRNIGRYNTYLDARRNLRWTPYCSLELYSGAAGEIEGIVSRVYNMDDEGVWNNAVIVENKKLGRAWYVPTRIKLTEEEVGKYISVNTEKTQKGKIRPLLRIGK